MATSHFPFPFPSAVTYPPPIFLGGYYTSPLPFSYSAPPAFPYAATYPYPPPASAYAPPPGFFPAPASAFPSATYPHRPDLWSTSTTPPESTAPPTPSPPNTGAPGSTPPSTQPWVASSPSPGLDHERVFQPLAVETAATIPIRRPDRVPSTPIPCGRSSTPPQLLDTGRTPLNRERTPLQNRLAMEPYANEGLHTPEKSRALCTGEKGAGKSGNVLHPATPDFTCQGGGLSNGNGAGGESISDETFVRKHTGPVSLSMPNAVPDHSFVKLKATTAPTPSFGFGITSTPATSGNATRSPLFGSTASAPLFSNTNTSSPFTTATTTRINSARLSPVCSMHASTGTATVAPQVFGEMPTPRSSQGTHGSATDYRSGHQTPIQCTCVPDGNNNLSEQNLDGVPQAYGLHNLNRQSVFRSDGTEHSYYALPENYPLERTTHEPVFDAYDDETNGCSTEFVDVFVGIPELQKYEDQQESEQLPKCFSMPIFSPERPTVGIDIDQLLKGTCKASKCRTWDEESQGDDIFLWEKSVCRTANVHYISFFPWDPGASAFLVTPLNNDNNNDTIGVFNEAVLDIPPAKPPERYGSADSLMDLMSQNGSEFRNGQLLGMPQSLTINSSELLRDMVTVLLQWDPGVAISSYMYMWPEMRAVKSLTWLQSPLFSDLQYQSQRSKTFSVWDPGILSLMDMMFGNTAVPNLFSSGLHIHRIPLADCSTLLPPTQITTSGSSKVEVDELTSPCVVLHLQQSTKWTSTSPNGIASSEYAYTLDFISDQWELHKQGVQKSYSAMSSPNYLQILEMDILFITFLPP